MRMNREDILESLGLQTRGPEAWLGPAMFAFGAGALVGVAAALLLSPRSGAELRGELLERSRRAVRRSHEPPSDLEGEPRRRPEGGTH